MPVEIKELVIRAVTDMGPETRKRTESRRDDDLDDQKAEIVEVCVREVLKVLRQAQEP